MSEGSPVLRALCPFHGSDRQRSLRVQVHSGRFVCFACGAWGYMETARERWREEQQHQAARQRPPALLPAGSPLLPPRRQRGLCLVPALARPGGIAVLRHEAQRDALLGLPPRHARGLDSCCRRA